MRDRLSIPCVVALMVCAVGLQGQRASAQASQAKIWQGVYSEVQAERGKAQYTDHCSRCHAPDLNGSRGPALAGRAFLTKWDGDDVGRLFNVIRGTMPNNNAAEVPDSDKIDIVAYILSVNSFPAGAEELKQDPDNDVFAAIQFVAKNQQGVAKVVEFGLVQLVGCLSQRPDHVWALTSTTEPVAAKDEKVTPQALKDAETTPLGTETFRLVNVTPPFKAESHKGHKVEVKGLVYHAPNENRLNLLSLQSVGSNCTN